ncbi:hypothetical protein LTR15_007269 [Elasticomyces elasticus]|nr:hypothetical protein LTR15_007269 [Elasticomyces elasticus]
MAPPRGYVSRAVKYQPHPEGGRAARRAAARSASNGPSRFLALPAELRVKIYELIFSPALTVVFRRKLPVPNQRKKGGIHWRYATEPHRGPTSQVRYCNELPMSDRTREKRKLPQGHALTLVGILFVNKQIYEEATAVLYGETTFLFERFEIARTFLRTAGSMNLEAIQSLVLEHVTQTSNHTDKAAEKQLKAEKSFANMCRQFNENLPKLKNLRVAIELSGPDQIVPRYANRGSKTFNITQYGERWWMQAIQSFSGSKQLQQVIVKFKMPSDFELRTTFIEQSEVWHGDPAFPRMFSLWLRYQKSLHHSMGLVVEKLIMGQKDEEVWRTHMQRLGHYRAFCFNPAEGVAKTIEDKAYKAFVADWDARAEEDTEGADVQPEVDGEGW